MGLTLWEPVGARVSVWAMNSDQRRTIEGWQAKFGVRLVEKVAMSGAGPLYPQAKGVYVNGNRFAARIQVDGRKINLGTYASHAEAHAAYLRARQEYRP